MTDTTSFTDPPDLHDPSAKGYSHIAIVQAGSKLAFISGQYGSGSGPSVAAPDFPGQVKQAFRNLHVAIKAAGAHLEGVAKLTVFIVDHSDERLSIFGEELSRVFGIHRPSMTLVPVPKLAQPDILFEVEAVVAIS